MADSNLSFTLKPMSAADIAECAQLAGRSFEKDRHTQLKAAAPTNPYNHAEGMKGGLEYYLSLPHGSVETAVAVEDSTRQILGWVVWGFRGFNSPEKEARREKELQQLHETGAESIDETSSQQAMAASEDASKSTRERIEAHTDADMDAWMKRLMPLGAKCMYICSISVLPEWQGKGVGSALMRVGTDRADAEGVYCWVHASEDGADMFVKHGFKEVGRLELDLDEWNKDNIMPPEGQGSKWGVYTFRYMRREANAA